MERILSKWTALLLPRASMLPNHATLSAGLHGYTRELIGCERGLEAWQGLRAEEWPLLPILGQKLPCWYGESHKLFSDSVALQLETFRAKSGAYPM